MLYYIYRGGDRDGGEEEEGITICCNIYVGGGDRESLHLDLLA
jgi:hypothetical protein